MVIEKDIPLPPREYMDLVCGANLPNVVEVFLGIGGKAVVAMLDEQGMLSPGIDFLDIGCGCGRTARHLIERRLHSYTGFDRHPGMIAWCQEEITRRAPDFRFHHFDVKSIYVMCDGHAGTVPAESFRFPFPDRSFDSILLASVFTHMPLEESAHYMKEMRRVLKPRGKALLSVFLSSKGPAQREHNFAYVPGRFLGAARRAGLTHRGLAPLRCDTYEHNWFVLSPGGFLARVSSWLKG